MNIVCCYRLIPNGEVIHTYINDKTHVAELMPLSYLDTRLLDYAEYNFSVYNGMNVDYAAMCEAILLSNKDYALVIESGNIGYFVLQWDGFWRFLETPMDTQNKGHMCIAPQPANFTFIGYRPTKLRQFRSCSGIYRLAYDKIENTIITNDGILYPEFDVSSLSQIDYHYKGYKEMLLNNAYAVVYQNGLPVFLEKTIDNKLILKGGM